MTISPASRTQIEKPFNASIHQEAAMDEHRGSDAVNMSHDALLLTEAIRAAQNAPDIRQEKVDALKAAIENGTYDINAKLIAERIANEETSLFI